MKILNKIIEKLNVDPDIINGDEIMAKLSIGGVLSFNITNVRESESVYKIEMKDDLKNSLLISLESYTPEYNINKYDPNGDNVGYQKGVFDKTQSKDEQYASLIEDVKLTVRHGTNVIGYKHKNFRPEY